MELIVVVIPGDAVAAVRRGSVAAGTALLLMAVLAGIGYGVAVGGLVTPDDPARTASDVLASEGLFRLGIVCLSAVVVLDVVVAWGLYLVYRPVDAGLAALAALLRTVYAAVFLVAVSRLVGAVDLLAADDAGVLPGLEQARAQALLEIAGFEQTWNAGLGLFGVHLVLVGVLIHRSGFTPRLLGGLVALAGLGYTVDAVAAVLTGGTAPQVSVYLFAGELLLAFWLLVRGRHAGSLPSPDGVGSVARAVSGPREVPGSPG
jgi:hypothetical protein